MNNETSAAVTAEPVTPAAPDRSSWLKVISTSLLASLIVAVVILAFTWPTKTMEAKNLPVSIAGPEVTVSQFEQSLKDKGIETFELKQASPAKRLNSKSSSAKPTAQSSSLKAPPPRC